MLSRPWCQNMSTALVPALHAKLLNFGNINGKGNH